MAKMACAKCGGTKMKNGGEPSMRDIKKMDRQDKRYMKKYEKQKAEELMKSKRFQKGGITQKIVGMPGYNATLYPTSFANGGTFAPNRPVQSSCKNGMVRDADGRCVMERKMAKGGSTSFGMLSVKAGVDKNPKPTAADRIVGAKKKMQMGGSSPSSGLTEKKKSAVAKKASAGKDIGKPGKMFDKIAAKAGGGDKGKRIAAAAMWKNIKRG